MDTPSGSSEVRVDWPRPNLGTRRLPSAVTLKIVQEVWFTLYGLGHFLLQELSTQDRKPFAVAVRSL